MTSFLKGRELFTTNKNKFNFATRPEKESPIAITNLQGQEFTKDCRGEEGSNVIVFIALISALCRANNRQEVVVVGQNLQDWISRFVILMEILDLKGCIITADALNTHKDIAAKAIELGADYALPVKDTLHWRLDVILREDHNRYRDKIEAQNLAVLRKIVLSALSQYKSKKRSIASKRLATATDSAYREMI